MTNERKVKLIINLDSLDMVMKGRVSGKCQARLKMGIFGVDSRVPTSESRRNFHHDQY